MTIQIVNLPQLRNFVTSKKVRRSVELNKAGTYCLRQTVYSRLLWFHTKMELNNGNLSLPKDSSFIRVVKSDFLVTDENRLYIDIGDAISLAISGERPLPVAQFNMSDWSDLLKTI